MTIAIRLCRIIAGIVNRWRTLPAIPVYFGRLPRCETRVALVVFPVTLTRLNCGISGIVAVRNAGRNPLTPVDEANVREMAEALSAGMGVNGVGGLETLFDGVNRHKTPGFFYQALLDPEKTTDLRRLSVALKNAISREAEALVNQAHPGGAAAVDTAGRRLELIRDIAWCVDAEILLNIEKVRGLIGSVQPGTPLKTIRLYRELNAVLNSIDRLEVRGRDSAGLSVLFFLSEDVFSQFVGELNNDGSESLNTVFRERQAGQLLLNRSITVNTAAGDREVPGVAVCFTYKIAAEIGRLGDNVAFLRNQIENDPLFKRMAGMNFKCYSLSTHTRWASVGEISEPNCHPVDNTDKIRKAATRAIIHVSLNGDIDNYRQLKATLEADGCCIQEEISTDTKIIPLLMNRFLCEGESVTEAFRRTVLCFEGSHAICVQTDRLPGKLLLAQRGSGQALFIGMGNDVLMASSEVYGFIEETSRYIKVHGETIRPQSTGVRGQIVVLDPDPETGFCGITGMWYDGAPLILSAPDIRTTQITTRDIDRQHFPHYFLKEIFEAPESVRKTLLNRWTTAAGDTAFRYVTLDETVVPETVKAGLINRRICKIFFVGQGTAGVAAAVCANILSRYIADPAINVRALKASELSGFMMPGNDSETALSDMLVIAITQSGTTTDTNRAVDMVRARGARTLAIVNRRDSDITFKVDGVFYTSSGRDIEMSVASTKAFYSQIVAGAILGLYIAAVTGRRDRAFVSREIDGLLALPNQMRTVLSNRERIAASAKRLAVTKTYWAVVGSGYNKAAANEIRIKLSELCYKTISSDYIEDKKHIDLSSEPLIIVCAAGAGSAVISDIIKDTAIFKAHKAAPVVIADDGREGFEPYAEDVFYVPVVSDHLAPVLNALAGHLWGYYAALSINEGSVFLYRFREDIRKAIGRYAQSGMDVYEMVLEKTFRETIIRFYLDFRKRKDAGRLPSTLGFEEASDLTLLLKYLSGRLPVSDFEIDFGVKGTALNMINCLFKCLGQAINNMARPVDAIKHQAKTVTVGTSRVSETLEGILFAALAENRIQPSQLINRNILVLKHLQKILSTVNGTILYRISGLNLLGEPGKDTTVVVESKTGLLAGLPSRVETDNRLKGTKRIIVRQGNVYIGKGRKDGRSIVIVPVISASPDTPNVIEYLLLLNISFKSHVPLPDKIKALGGKFEHIQNIVQENSLIWEDRFLEMVAIDDLFGLSAEKIAEKIVSQRS